MAKMKAVCMHSFGGPEVLKVEEIDIPEPGDDEVLVRVHAASVNPVDYKILHGSYSSGKQQPDRTVLGRDIAGTVEICGSAVRHLRPGDDVYAMLNGGPGGYAQHVVVKADICAPEPKQLDHIGAAAVPLAGLTAWQGLFDEGGLRMGQRVLIHGGAGGVGHFAIQFAKLRGATVITTVAPQDVEFVRALGADQAIDHTRQPFEEEVRDSVDLVFDLIGGDTQERSWAVLKEGGTLISTLAKPSEEKAREHHARAKNYRTHPDGVELAEIGRLIDSGHVRPYVTAMYPLERAGEALERIENKHVQGKVVLQVT